MSVVKSFSVDVVLLNHLFEVFSIRIKI
jgi:hypothetical protein